MRNLTKTIAVVSLLAPASGHPLGIGDIKLHSALNQNLDADISLVVSADENASDIKVSLAPLDKFDEAGVPWTSFLSKIKFEPVVRPNGSVVVKLSSKEAVKEPFLDFLLEVSWPKGSLYREFTVLVDPPSVYKEATIPVSTSAERDEPAPAFAPQQPVQTSEQNGVDSSGEYGPTSRTDTLWSISERASRGSNVSAKQMMIAIYEANPHAFYEKNMYALTAGKTLKIPEREVILKLSRNQATAEFNRQTKAWKNRSAPATETTVVKTDAVDNQLTLVAPTKAPVAADNVVVAPGKEQVTAENIADNASQKTPEAVDTEGESEDSASGTVSADATLQSKVAALEKQMAMMQDLIALKDQQLAALQNQVRPVPAAQEQVAQAAPVEVAVDSSVDQSKSAPQPIRKPEAQSAIQLEPEASDSSSSYYLVVGGVGSGVLALLGWLWWWKRKVDEVVNTESMFASSIMIKMPETDENPSAPIAENNAVYDVGTVGESSFLIEFTPSDFDSFETDHNEIDPISEADVYLAYGRYQQAEELIRQAIKDHPDRNECKLKLLEIFYANENKESFEDYANELAEAGKKESAEFWEKVTEMGREICPDSKLFSSGGDLFAEINHAVVGNVIADNTSGDEAISFEAASFGEELSGFFAKETTEVKDSVLDFDLTSFGDEDDSIIDEQQNNEDIDFDLSSFSTDIKGADEFDKSITSLETQVDDNKKEEQGFESYEFDFDFDSNKAEATEIGGFDLSAVKDAGESHQYIDFSTAKSLDLNDNSLIGDFDFDLGLDMFAAGSSEQGFNQHEGFAVSDLTDMDELETKLDLAKAYIDMGDVAAAKDIAKEVLEKGAAEQKKIALSLLDELS
ncbi:MAG: tetratricopeptide repeat protein [Methylobacter sp.]|nr:tetratricopeptide repeat protein [Methylobacter sp.]